jgi:hypothetical protein
MCAPQERCCSLVVWVVAEVALCCVPAEDLFSKSLCLFWKIRYCYAIDNKEGILALWYELVPGKDLKQPFVILSIINSMSPILSFGLSDYSLERPDLF